jgi:hypothetical protein
MCDCNYPEVFSDRLVKAKKACNCYECGSAIAEGEKYHSVFGVWDHDARSYRFCCNCQALRSWLLKLDLPDADCCLGTYGSLHEELSECGFIFFEEGEPVEVDERLELIPGQDNNWKLQVREVVGCSN